MVRIKLATIDDMDWINEQYRKIDFVPSDISKGLIAIAEINSEKAGLGRLVPIDEKNAELGGMYVFEKFRHQGIARSIVDFLLSPGKKYQTIYCLPFEHLKIFYESFGFSECNSNEFAPTEIINKHSWCNKTYSHKVLLLKKPY